MRRVLKPAGTLLFARRGLRKRAERFASHPPARYCDFGISQCSAPPAPATGVTQVPPRSKHSVIGSWGGAVAAGGAGVETPAGDVPRAERSSTGLGSDIAHPSSTATNKQAMQRIFDRLHWAP
jgi:hypothetical protein